MRNGMVGGPGHSPNRSWPWNCRLDFSQAERNEGGFTSETLSPGERGFIFMTSVELLPVLAAKRPSIPGRKRVSFVLAEIGSQRPGALGRGKRLSLLISQCASHHGRRDFGDLVSVD